MIDSKMTKELLDRLFSCANVESRELLSSIGEINRFVDGVLGVQSKFEEARLTYLRNLHSTTKEMGVRRVVFDGTEIEFGQEEPLPNQSNSKE